MSYTEDRRNALTPAMERAKVAEAKKFDKVGEKLPDQVYTIGHMVNGVKKLFYVGIAVDPPNRWAQHKREAALGLSDLPEYEQMRYIGVENCIFEVVDMLGEFTEREWYDILRENGHVLLNDPAKLVDNKRKRRTKYAHQAALEGRRAPSRTREEQEAWWVKVMIAARGEPIT